MIKIGRVRIRYSIFFVLSIFLGCEISLYMLIVIFSILMHELGHIFAMVLYGKKINAVEISGLGVTIETSEGLTSYTGEIFVSCFGPIVNSILAIISYILIRLNINTEYSVFLFCCNALYAVINILPAKGLDGGRILENLLLKYFSFDRAEKILSEISLCFVVLLWVISVYVLIKTTWNFTLFSICCYLFFKLSFPKEKN